MTLPEPVKRFWYAAMALGRGVERTPWGAVATDDRFPLVWDANSAAVLEPDGVTTAAGIREVLYPALAAAGAPYEHVEFWETEGQGSILEEFRREADIPDPDVVMVSEGTPPDAPPTEVRVEEMTDPGTAFWPWYRESLREFGMALSEDVLDQMVRRTREVLLPAGLRWFVGHLDGRPAGYASLISLEDVGYMDNVVTVPELRRRGVATACVAGAVRTSTEGGDRLVFLLAERDGYPQRLYERMGFRTVAPVESFTTPLGSEVRS
jgi:GNAT superfamily N-acetyltransferase